MSKRPNKSLTDSVERAASRVLLKDGRLTYPALFIELGILDRRDL